MLRLNLGCSDAAQPGFINVDRWEPPWATTDNFQRVDLGGPWPWESGSVEHIRAVDIIEHLADKTHTMNELHRVLKPGGTVEIIVPTTDGRGAFQDPTHVSFWNRNSFFYYEHGNPHLERFKDAYGITARFKVAFERNLTLDDGVTKLHIVLEAVETAHSITLRHPDGRVEQVETEPEAQVKTGGFAFSIIHSSARPNEWRKVYDAWLSAAAHPEQVEYVLCVDEHWGFPSQADAAYGEEISGIRQQDRVIWNTGRRCYVDGVNLAAAASSGDVLIVNADDQYPCDKWDEELSYQTNGKDSEDFVIEVSTNTPTEHERAIMVMPILSRERYERFGWVFYPEYESMFADNDFCQMAKRDKCIIDARHLVFPHKHWINGQREKDEQDRAQNSEQAYNEGAKLFAARKRINFSGIPPKVEAPTQALDTKIPMVAFITPGSVFPAPFLAAWTNLWGYLASGNKYNITHLVGYTSNAGMVRTALARLVLTTDYGAPVDYVMWIDDDNTVTPEQFEMLMDDLRTHPEYDAVCGWTWCAKDDDPEIGRATISCGALVGLEATVDGQDVKFTKIKQVTPKEMHESPTDLIEIGYSGFPAVLMRVGLLTKAGKELFNPYVDPRCEYGFSGEDVAFFARATIKSGARYAVDRRVKVPHYKRRAIEPVPTAEQMQEAMRKTTEHFAVK
jgi:SAM-dependent methyltransferase